MGAWGYYDDENDEVSDIYNHFTSYLVKSYVKEAYKYKKIRDYEKYIKILDEFMIKKKSFVGKELVKFIENNKNKLTFQETVGLALRLARHGKFPNMLSSNNLPKKLFIGYPIKLKKMVKKILQILIKEEDRNMFKKYELRIDALKNELKLFK
jgi:hypothetical protein